jgi:uncharacterized protein YdcH (DUF465 family)
MSDVAKTERCGPSPDAGAIRGPAMPAEGFIRLVEEYHELNRRIQRIETMIEPAPEEVEDGLKRRRLLLRRRIEAVLDA